MPDVARARPGLSFLEAAPKMLLEARQADTLLSEVPVTHLHSPLGFGRGLQHVGRDEIPASLSRRPNGMPGFHPGLRCFALMGHSRPRLRVFAARGRLGQRLGGRRRGRIGLDTLLAWHGDNLRLTRPQVNRHPGRAAGLRLWPFFISPP